MEKVEIKKVSIDKAIPAFKLVWDTMKEFNQLNDCIKNSDIAEKYFIEDMVGEYLDDEIVLIGAFIENEIIGVIGSRDNYINFFFVKKEYQNKKIGKKLMITMINNLKRKGIEKIEVDSSSYALNIYKHFGFYDVEGFEPDTNEHPMVYKLRRDEYGISK